MCIYNKVLLLILAQYNECFLMHKKHGKIIILTLISSSPHSSNISKCVKYMKEIFQKMVNVTW